MEECKVIVFKEAINNPGMARVIEEETRLWYDLNKDTIHNIHSIFGIEHCEESPAKVRKIITIHYYGEAGINPFECNHDDTSFNIINLPTCHENGITEKVCNNCKLLIETLNPDKLEHQFEFISNNDATCLEDGTLTGTCILCGDKIIKEDINSALGHNYIRSIHKKETCITDRIEVDVCSRCNDTITYIIENSKLGHEYPDEWTVKIPATDYSEGLEFKHCIRCGNEITQSIPIKFKLTILTDNINEMFRNHEFNQKILCNVTSGYTCSLIDGVLPNGITLSTDGTLSGTPTTEGTYTFKLQVEYPEKNQSTSKEFTIEVKSMILTVTFDPNGGTTSETTREVAEGYMIGQLPEPNRDGYVFGGWFTAASGGLKVDEYYSVASDTTLYARWGQGSNLEFGDATSQFNMEYNNDRTNYKNQPYTFYSRYSNGKESDITIQTAISSSNNINDNNMTDDNNTVKLYMKVTNNGEAGTFDIGFDCDSYVENNDCLKITRLANGVNLDNFFTVTVPYSTAIWIGKYNNRVNNRYNDVEIGYSAGGVSGARPGGEHDTGYAFTMTNIFINSDSYTILEVTFQKIVNTINEISD